MVAAAICYNLSAVRIAYRTDKRKRSGAVYIHNILNNIYKYI